MSRTMKRLLLIPVWIVWSAGSGWLVATHPLPTLPGMLVGLVLITACWLCWEPTWGVAQLGRSLAHQVELDRRRIDSEAEERARRAHTRRTQAETTRLRTELHALQDEWRRQAEDRRREELATVVAAKVVAQLKAEGLVPPAP